MEDHLYWNTEFISGKGLWSCLFAIRVFRKRRVRGLRYTVQQMSSNLLHLKVAAGSHAGSRLTLPRVSCGPGNDKCFVQGFKRTQYPVRVCFGMKIKKAQGQTSRGKLRLDVSEDCFAYGQYVEGS